MKIRLRLACLSLLALSAALPASAQRRPEKAEKKEPERAGETEPVVLERNEELSLAIGENKTISALDVKSFAEGVKGIADVRLTPDASQFVIVGQKPGSTTLLLLKNDKTQVNYQINVSPRPMQSVERELLQLLEGTTGVRVRRVVRVCSSKGA
jgi:pilus assembly protein CpaC